MSDDSKALDQQIAALEAALQLPLPEESRRQLTEQLRSLQAQQAGARGGIRGTVDVSGELRGNAIGVNLGTVQTFWLFRSCRGKHIFSYLVLARHKAMRYKRHMTDTAEKQGELICAVLMR